MLRKFFFNRSTGEGTSNRQELDDGTPGQVLSTDGNGNLVFGNADKLGWGNYPDNQYTEGSAFAISANTDTVVPNNDKGSLLNESELPQDLDTFYAPGTLLYDNGNVLPTKGETITGQTSSATAQVVSVDGDSRSGKIYLSDISGTFQDNEILDVGNRASITCDGTLGSGVILGKNGDSYLITVELVIKPTSGSTTFIEFWFDIGGGINNLYRRIISFPKGNGIARPATLTTAVYSLNTWQANGALLYCRANGTADLYDIRFVIFRLHQSQAIS